MNWKPVGWLEAELTKTWTLLNGVAAVDCARKAPPARRIAMDRSKALDLALISLVDIFLGEG